MHIMMSVIYCKCAWLSMEIGYKCECVGIKTGHWQFTLCWHKYKLGSENERYLSSMIYDHKYKMNTV